MKDTLHAHKLHCTRAFDCISMSFWATARKIPKWQLGLTGGLVVWAAALQVSCVFGMHAQAMMAISRRP